MRLQILLALVALVPFAIGCEKPTTKPNSTSEAAHDHGHDHAESEADHGHDHADAEHDHSAHDDEHDHPAHGPNNGHLFKFESTEYQGEWKQSKDNNEIKMYVLSMDEKPVKLKVDHFHVIPLAGNDQTPFELVAEGADADGAASVYTLDDQNLKIAIPLGVAIELKMGDKTLKGKIDSHEPYDH